MKKIINNIWEWLDEWIDEVYFDRYQDYRGLPIRLILNLPLLFVWWFWRFFRN